MSMISPRHLAISATFLTLLAQTAGAGWGGGVVETVYVEPTGTTLVLPASYSEMVPTSFSYAVPSSFTYAVPTSYVATSATLMPASYAYTSASYVPTTTSYYAPAYYRRGLLGRWRPRGAIYETSPVYAASVTPTAFYLPSAMTTTVPTSLTATAYRGPCQESAVAFNPPPTVPTQTTKAFASTPKGEPAFNGQIKAKDPAVEAAKAQEAAKEKQGGGIAEEPRGMGDGQPSPPPAPAPDKKEDPKDPLPDDPKPGERQAGRPAATVMRARAGASAQNVLRGEVVSGVSGKPIMEAEVIFSNPTGKFKDRARKTDLKGGFEVFLPEGDWSITVRDTSAGQAAEAKVMGQVTSASGKYFDGDDKPIYSLKLFN